jgi:hypothetical protein
MSRGLQLVISAAASLVLLVIAPQILHSKTESGAVQVDVAGPMVIGFFPPVSDEDVASSSGTREGLAHLEFALSDVAKCLKSRGVSVRVERTRALVLKVAGKERRFDIPPEWERAVGAYLIAPGRDPRVVYASAGPSSLQVRLPNAVAEYFAAPACKVAAIAVPAAV